MAEHEKSENESGIYCRDDRRLTLAELFHLVGDKENATRIYKDLIDENMKDHQHATEEYIDKAIKLTGEKVLFTKKRILLYELKGEFCKAAKLAKEIGQTQQAESYMAIHKMIHPENKNR